MVLIRTRVSSYVYLSQQELTHHSSPRVLTLLQCINENLAQFCKWWEYKNQCWITKQFTQRQADMVQQSRT